MEATLLLALQAVLSGIQRSRSSLQADPEALHIFHKVGRFRPDVQRKSKDV